MSAINREFAGKTGFLVSRSAFLLLNTGFGLRGCFVGNVVLTLKDCKTARVIDGAFWFLLLQPLIFPQTKSAAPMIYGKLLPFLNSRALVANSGVSNTIRLSIVKAEAGFGMNLSNTGAVTGVVKGGAAHLAGVRSGMMVLEIDGIVVTTVSEIVSSQRALSPLPFVAFPRCERAACSFSTCRCDRRRSGCKSPRTERKSISCSTAAQLCTGPGLCLAVTRK